MNVIEHINIGKPYAVFSVLDTDRGRGIAEEMKEWLIPNYHLFEVIHDGSLYEQPALRFMQDLCIRTKQPCLYVHTKGAAHNSNRAKKIRELWRREFTNNAKQYISPLDVEHPVCTTPFSGRKHNHTWYNGFFVNHKAMEEIQEIQPSNNRYDFESLFNESKVNVVGIIMKDVDLGEAKMTLMRQYVDKI